MPRDLRTAYLAASRRDGGTLGPRGLEYLYRLVIRLARRAPGGPRDVAPADLCRALEAAAAADFGRLAPLVLGRWGLRSGGDIGRAVHLLAAEACLTLKEGENLDDYRAYGEFRCLAA